MKRVFKVADRDEFLSLRYFHRSFPGNVARATAFDDEMNILTVEFAGETYDELKQNGRLTYGHLEDALFLLARLQKCAEEASLEGELCIEDVISEDRDYFTSRAERLFGQFLTYDQLCIFRENYWPVDESLRGLKRRFHKDFNLGNIAEGPIVFDFEQLRFLPAQVDLVNFLEFYSPYLDDSQIRSLLGFYVKASNKVFDEKLDVESFIRDYDYAAFHRHLEIAAYRAQSLSNAYSERDELARSHHIRRAHHYLKRIISNEQDPRKEAFEKLDEIVSGIECTPEAGGFRVRPASRAKPLAVFFSALSLFSLGLILRGAFESREFPELNKIQFSGKNHAIVARIEDLDDIGPSPKYELYIAGSSGAEKFGDISVDCLSWAPGREKILFAQKRQFVTYDFSTGERKRVGLRYSPPACPVFFGENTLVWKDGDEIAYFNMSEAVIGSLSPGSAEFEQAWEIIGKLPQRGLDLKSAVYSSEGVAAYVCGDQLCIGGSAIGIRGQVSQLSWSGSSGLFIAKFLPGDFDGKQIRVMNVYHLDPDSGREVQLTFNGYPPYEILTGTKGVEFYIK